MGGGDTRWAHVRRQRGKVPTISLPPMRGPGPGTITLSTSGRGAAIAPSSALAGSGGAHQQGWPPAPAPTGCCDATRLQCLQRLQGRNNLRCRLVCSRRGRSSPAVSPRRLHGPATSQAQFHRIRRPVPKYATAAWRVYKVASPRLSIGCVLPPPSKA